MACEGCTDISCGCCCSPLSQFANSRVAGLHPEHIAHESFVVTGSEASADSWGTLYQLVKESTHVVGISVFTDPNNASATADLQGMAIRFYTASDPDDKSTYNVLLSVMLEQGKSYTFGDEILGMWFDYGIFAQVVGNSAGGASTNSADRALINLSHVHRPNYSPAYIRGDRMLQHYWSCSSGGDDFQHNWYSGNSNDAWDGSGSVDGTANISATALLPPGVDFGDPTRLSFVVDENGNPVETETGDLLQTE